MINKKIKLGMMVITLVFGMSVMGCDKGAVDSNDRFVEPEFVWLHHLTTFSHFDSGGNSVGGGASSTSWFSYTDARNFRKVTAPHGGFTTRTGNTQMVTRAYWYNDDVKRMTRTDTIFHEASGLIQKETVSTRRITRIGFMVDSSSAESNFTIVPLGNGRFSQTPSHFLNSAGHAIYRVDSNGVVLERRLYDQAGQFLAVHTYSFPQNAHFRAISPAFTLQRIETAGSDAVIYQAYEASFISITVRTYTRSQGESVLTSSTQHAYMRLPTQGIDNMRLWACWVFQRGAGGDGNGNLPEGLRPIGDILFIQYMSEPQRTDFINAISPSFAGFLNHPSDHLIASMMWTGRTLDDFNNVIVPAMKTVWELTLFNITATEAGITHRYCVRGDAVISFFSQTITGPFTGMYIRLTDNDTLEAGTVLLRIGTSMNRF